MDIEDVGFTLNGISVKKFLNQSALFPTSFQSYKF
jgi:hypothetical protein